MYQQREYLAAMTRNMLRAMLRPDVVPLPSARRELARLILELELLDADKAELLRLRVLWGASLEQVAQIMAISEAQVAQDWRFCKRWLAARMATLRRSPP